MTVIEYITNSQVLLNGLNLEVSKVRLVKLDERLAEDKSLLGKIDSLRGPMIPTYFLIVQEIRALEDEREKILKILDTKNIQTANLQIPIYVANKQVYPRKAISLVAGLLGGLFFGLLIALSRQVMSKLKSKVGGAS
jgi:hypothetical protein